MNQQTVFRLDMSHVSQSGISVIKTKPIFAYPAHRHTFYEISFYTGGRGDFHINTLPFTVRQPTVVLMTPADMHEIHRADPDFSSIKVCFQEAVLPDRQILPRGAYVFECGTDAALVQELFEELLRHSEDVRYGAFLLSAIILKVVKEGTSVVPVAIDPVYDHIAKALQYINDNFCEDVTLTQAARLLHISPQYLSAIFKKNLGISFVAYVRQLRLHYSIQLLGKKNLSITEIAFSCGFGNVSHYLRSFKGEFGMSPGKYRKNLR